MNTKSSRLPTKAGAAETAAHVLRGEKNEEITLIRGCEQDLHDFVEDARRAKKPYAIRHFKVSPEHDITPEQEREAVAVLAGEFGFDPDRVVLVRHKKPRSRKMASEYHLHLLVPEYDPVSRRVLGTRWDYARHEKCSRVLEASWGHAFVPGRFNAAVANALKAEGMEAEAKAVRALEDGSRPEATHPQHQVQEIARRTEWTAGRITEAVRDTAGMAATSDEFRTLLHEQGLRVVEGEKGRRWVVEAPTTGGGWIHAGAVNRLLKAEVAATNEWMRGLSDRPAMIGVSAKRKAPVGRITDGQDRSSVETHGLRRGQGRDAGSLGPARGGPARDADGLRGGPGQRDDGRAADGTARPGQGGRRGIGAHPDRGPAVRAGGPAARPGRAAEGARVAALLAREAGRRDGDGGGRRGRAPAPSRTGPVLPGPDWPQPRHAENLREIVAVAGLQWRYGRPDRLEWLARTAAETRPQTDPLPGERNRGIAEALDDAERRQRKARFHAMLLRRAYSLRDWLPPEALLHLRRVDVHADTGRVMISLEGGARILDTGDRIVLRGHLQEFAAAEMAACAERRGWQAVEIDGDPEFRIAMSRELLLRGIEVVDCPLSPDEQEELRRSSSPQGSDWAGGFDWRTLEGPELLPPAPVPPWAIEIA